MKTALECIPCFVRQAAEVVDLCIPDQAQRCRVLKLLLEEIARADWNVMPVSISRLIQRIVRGETGNSDPYRAIKDRMNRVALDLLPALAEEARRRNEIPNPEPEAKGSGHE